jgi:DNA-binding CsgD family transcriptional regulator
MHSIVEKRAGPGVLLVSAAMQLIYCDQCARELCLLLNKDGSENMGSAALPAAVLDFCREAIDLLNVRGHAKDWEEFQIKRVIGTPSRPILVRGIGMPARQGPGASVLVIMEEVGRRQIDRTDEAKQQFALTDREMTVILHLMKGATNKEIAMALDIVEQTVKEHIKNIMHKTKTSTRTGILIEILGIGCGFP